MFNFASKVFNAIGDLVSDVDPTKPAQPAQPSGTQPSPQRRSSAEARFYQIKSQPRFPAPSQPDDHLPRLGSSSVGGGIGGGHVRPSSAPVYRYPTTTAHTTPSYRPERYEESKFKAPDIDYNEDGYNVGRNYNGSERQSSYITELQKEYGMYREHDVDDANDYEEEDRYSLGYENEGNRRRRSLSSERENSQLKNTEEYNENVIYSDTDRNHYARENHHQSKNEPSTSIYDTHQLFSADSYGSNESQNTNDFAQFTSGGVASTSSWISEEVDDYNKSRRRRKSNSESDKQFRIDHEDKISPSPPSQDEDARNSSRSESESSDEISFGEALATGLIPPNITPEIAARMNIEFINHPKAVIESFYGHSPGEVYTIPEEEDEICSPTGADGVTSLRKQRMASARVESTSSDPKELQNQRGRIPSSNQQSDSRLKQKYSGQSIDSKSELERQLISDDMKENRPMGVSEFVTSQDTHKMFNPVQKFQPEEHRPGVKQPFRYVQSTTQQPDTAQFNYGPEKPVQQQPPQPQQQKPYKSETRPQPYQPEIRPQMYQPEVRPQIYQPDGRPHVYQYDRPPQPYPTEIRPPGYNSADRSQLYQGDRLPQNYQPDSNRTQYPAQVGQTPQNYPVENIQPYQTDNRSPQHQQQQQQQPQTYQSDTMNQGFQPIPQNNRAQGYQPDNRPQNYQTTPPQGFQPPQNYPKDGRTQGYQQQQPQHQQPQQPQQQTDRPQNYPASDRPVQQYPAAENQGQGYQQGYQPQNYPPDNRPPQGYQPQGQPGYQQGHPADNRPPGYQQVTQGHPTTYPPATQGQPVYQQGVQGHPPDGRPIVYPQGQPHPPDNRSQVYQPDGRSQGYPQNGRPPQGYPPDNRQYADRSQNYPPDNRPVQGFQQDNRSQPYPTDPRSQPYQQDNRQKPQENRRLPQPQQYDDQSQRPPNQNYPQGPYRDSDNQYQQFQKHPNDLQDDRRLPPQQDYQDQYRRQQPDPRDDPQDPEGRQFADQGQNRRRLPLRKYNSEERYGSYQQDYDRRGSSHESPGRMQHEEEYDAQGKPVRRFPERLKHRSSSLEHDRDDQHYGRSRSSSFERSHYPDDAEYEEYSGRDQRRASLEHKKVLPRVGQQGTSSKQVQSRGQSRSSSGNSDKTRIHKQGSWQESSSQDHSRSRLQQDSRKDENFCLQHKKYTGTPSSVSKPTRRVLPKEPSGQAQRKTIKRSQSQDKSTTTLKSEDSSHQRAGILSNAARKTERSGHLKITFSDPISNLLNPKKNTASSVAGHSRTESSSKNTSTKSDKPVITSNILPQSKNYIYPLPVVKTPNQPEPANRSPIPAAPSPLYRNQSQFDQSLRDSRLPLSPNTRSLPIPIAQRTCSLDRYSSSETNLNTSPYYHDQFSRPGSAPGLMYEPVHQSGGNQPNPLSLYELHALKKEEKFWSDIYSALPADMKHLITNRGIGGPMSRKLSSSNASFSSVVSSPATVIGGSHPAERASLENRIMQRSMMAKGQAKGPNQGRDNFQSSLGERIGNRLRMLHEMKEQAAAGFSNRRKMADTLSRRSASDGEYSFASSTNFPLCWNLTRRPHSDSAIDLIDRLEVQNSPTRVSGSAYNSSEYLTKVVDKSQSYLTSPCTNVPPSPAPAQPVRMLRDTALRGDHTESLQVNNYLPLGDNRSGFFSCLQNIESLTRQYEEEDRMRTELDYDDEIYSEPGMPDPEYGGRYHRGLGHPRRRDQQF